MTKRRIASQTAFVLLCVSLLAGQIFAQNRAFVRGQVVDETEQPMAFVNVQIIDTTDGAITGRDGRFAFTTKHLGPHDLSASFIGFEPTRQPLHLTAGDTTTVRLVLRRILIELGETVVTVSTYTTGEDETVTLAPLDVVTTPGASADIFRAFKTFPGVATVDNGAGLFVRGGDVSETVILLDQATVVHPYKYESPTGGVFGTIPPFMVQDTAFSTGGFSARYGNALSAVLAMESLDMPLQRSYTLGLGLAAGSVGLDLPLVEGKLGLRFTGNRSFTDLLFRINGHRDKFVTTPQGHDGNLNLIYQYSPTGRLEFFSFDAGDKIGVQVTEPSFDGLYRNRSDRALHNVQWTDVWADWSAQTSVSLNQYKTRRQLGNLDLTPRDWTGKIRTDWERVLGTLGILRLGAEMENANNRYVGRIPQGDIFDPEAEVFELDVSYNARRPGAYFEVDFKPVHRIVANVGMRADHHSLSDDFVLDPRLSARYQFSEDTNARLAWGLYHQFPAPFDYNPTSGNPNLGPQRAQHWIGGLHHERGQFLVRLEAYHKPYHNLVIDDPDLNLVNEGRGRASGIDLFLKYGAFLNTRLSGWMAYSLLRSRRLQVRHLGFEMLHEEAPSPFDITHNLTLVTKMQIVRTLSGGLTLRYATGRPITPIVGAVSVADKSYYLPVEGPVGSERLPSFQQIDGQLSYVHFFSSGHQAVFYLAVNNLLNRANVLGYEYSIDYTQRQPRTSLFRRSIYFGTSISLNY
jgi:hypothetical protein